jgi:Pectate lyase superfamily protein/Right handed beta helix region
LRMRSRFPRVMLLLLLFSSWLDGQHGRLLIATAFVNDPVVAQADETSNGAIFAERMKCDGTTDDTVEFQNAIDAARKSAKRLLLPSGTCLVTSTISIPDRIWIQGRGKLSTTIRRKSGVNLAMDMFGLSGASGGVTITDLTIDGNKDGNPSAGQYSLGAAGVQAVGVRKLTIQRTRWINAYLAAIGLFVNQGQYVADTLVADSDFENNGRGTTFTSDQLCNSGDMAMRAPLRVKVVYNRSDNAQGNFVCFGTNANAGVGDVVVSDNVVRNAAGFGIALGGISGKGAVLSHNTLDQPSSRQSNIDLALWSDVTVIDNHIIGGSACLEHGCAGIGDAPPAQRVIVTGNTIVAAKSVPGSLCIGLGGSDLTISRNTCQNAGGAGIGIAVSDQTQSHHIEISRNVVKNSSQAQAGIHAGIELFILCGPGPKCTGGSGTISDVTIESNTVYDDQNPQTQGSGVGVALFGQTTGFTRISILNNDLRRSGVRPILSRAPAISDWVIRGNSGPNADAPLLVHE